MLKHVKAVILRIASRVPVINQLPLLTGMIKLKGPITGAYKWDEIEFGSWYTDSTDYKPSLSFQEVSKHYPSADGNPNTYM